MVDSMLRFIGQITVTLAARDRAAAEARLRILARVLNEAFSDVLFADHRGEVGPYWPVDANSDRLQSRQGIPRFDSFEIHGVVPAKDEAGEFLEPVDDSEAELWSLYGHLPGYGLKSIGTFPNREQAEAIYAALTGRPYPHPGCRDLCFNSAA